MDTHELYRGAVASFTQAGVPSPQHDARAIFEFVLDAKMYLWPTTIDRGTHERIEQLVLKRSTRIPLQHILGKMWFYGLELHAQKGVFNVRPETEILAKWAIDLIGGRPLRVLDLCSGSGALALAIAANTPAEVTAVEKSSLAVQSARSNARRLGLDVQIIQADALVFFKQWAGSFDLVVANPPYVPLRDLEPEVMCDPAQALWGGGEDGLDSPKRLIKLVRQYLKPEGYFGMEHDDTQGAATVEAAMRAGYACARTLTDLNEADRFLIARNRKENYS